MSQTFGGKDFGVMCSQQSITALQGNEDFVILVFKVHR